MPHKKKVLIDLTNYGKLTSGFGQIATNYASFFSRKEIGADLQFVYLLPKNCHNDFGDHITCVRANTMHKLFPFLLPKVDLWHTVNQQRKLLRLNGNTKYIFTIHDFNFLTEKKPWKAKLYLQRMQQRADKATVVTAISHYVAGVVNDVIDLKGKEIRVIYNGVERIDHLEGKAPSFVVKNRPFFFAIGQIRRKKNFHLLVEMMKFFPDHDLYICGDTHFEYARQIEQMITEKQITNAYLAGSITQEEKIWLYKNSSAFLFPSEGEGFGLPAIEATQFGKAVFIANKTSLPEICSGHALIWENLLPEDMAKLVKDNLPNFYLDEERINRVKEHAQSFSYEKHVNAYLKLYEELLQSF